MKKLLVFGFLALSSLACSPPMATLTLVEQAKGALAEARKREISLHEKLIKAENKNLKALDQGFDSDVRLCAAGQIKKPDGTPVVFSPEWVITSRKAYSAGVLLTATNIQTQTSAHANALDNLSVGEEMLEKVSTIVVMQQNLNQNVKGWILGATKKVGQ
jgi:hypothetical protein